MTLTEFLLARIAEDEVVARTAIEEYPVERYALYDDPTGLDTSYCDRDYLEAMVRISPARVLAECEAKRQIVEFHSEPLSWMDSPTASPRLICILCGTDDITWPCRTLRALAAVYADHPDYDPAWALDA